MQQILNGGGLDNSRWMTLSDPALSPHYIIANCFLPQRADAVNGYKSRYIRGGQSSINNASLVTTGIRDNTADTGVTDISAVPTKFQSQLVETENLQGSRSFIAPGHCQSPALMAMRLLSLLSCCRRVPVYSSGADTGSTSCWGNSKTSGLRVVVVCLG